MADKLNSNTTFAISDDVKNKGFKYANENYTPEKIKSLNDLSNFEEYLKLITQKIESTKDKDKISFLNTIITKVKKLIDNAVGYSPDVLKKAINESASKDKTLVTYAPLYDAKTFDIPENKQSVTSKVNNQTMDFNQNFEDSGKMNALEYAKSLYDKTRGIVGKKAEGNTYGVNFDQSDWNAGKKTSKQTTAKNTANKPYKIDDRTLKEPDIYALPQDIQDYYIKLKMENPTPEKLNLYKSPDSWTNVLTSALEGAVTAGKGYIQNNANDEQFRRIVAGLEKVTGKKYSKLTPEEFAKHHEEFNNILAERNKLGQKLSSKEVQDTLKQYEDMPNDKALPGGPRPDYIPSYSGQQTPDYVNDIVNTRMQYNQTNQDLNNIQNEVNQGTGFYDASAPDLANENRIKNYNEYLGGTLNAELDKNKALFEQKLIQSKRFNEMELPFAIRKIEAARSQNELDAITAQFMSGIMNQTK